MIVVALKNSFGSADCFVPSFDSLDCIIGYFLFCFVFVLQQPALPTQQTYKFGYILN
jgi:hypothetical protein